MARIEGVRDHEAGWLTRLSFGAVRRASGKVSEGIRIAAHRPSLFFGWMLHEALFRRPGRVAPSLRTLAQIKVAMLVGCPL